MKTKYYLKKHDRFNMILHLNESFKTVKYGQLLYYVSMTSEEKKKYEMNDKWKNLVKYNLS